MKKLGDFLNSSLAKKGLGKTLTSAQICFLADEWAKSRYKTISFSGGILKVSVTSSSAAQAVQMEEENLIEYLNKKIGRKAVKAVRIVNQG